MSVTRMLVFLLCLSFGALVWTYSDYMAARSEASNAIEDKRLSDELLQEIQFLREKTGEAVKLVPRNLDIYPIINGCIRQAGIERPTGFQIQPTQLRNIEESGVREWKITMPPLTATAAQTDTLIRSLVNSEFGCQVKSIKMIAAKPGSAVEKWKVELEIGYLRLAQ